MSAVPISAGGKCCRWVCTTGLAFTNQQLQLSCNDHYLGGPLRADNEHSLVSGIVVIHASLLRHELELGRSHDPWSDTLQ